jgi:hypothetical protein
MLNAAKSRIAFRLSISFICNILFLYYNNIEVLKLTIYE